MRDETQIERAIARAFRPQRRLSRRMFLRQTGRGAVIAGSALSLPAILAACGIGPGGSTAPSAGSQAALPSAPAGTLDFANWPAYIDIDEETGDYPTLAKFTEESGIEVAYTEAINDNEEFFGIIQPDLAAGNPPQYDLIVMTDWMIEKMIRLGYLSELDRSKLPNFDANALDLYKDPWYDPGNVHSMAWQSGITGIGYNPTLTGREITTFDDLLDPEFAGRVGLFSEMRDTMSLALLSLGIEPEEATVDQATQAKDKLLAAAQAGQFRNFYGNDYYDELANGNLAVTVAWSGDVSQMKLYDNPDVEFVVPDTGGMLWIDNMAIPNKAAHPLDAHMMMNFWYDIENAVPLTEYVGYFSPVTGVTERVLEDAETAEAEGDQEWADALRVISATANPTDEVLANVHNYRKLSEEEEAQWNDLFNEVVAG
ncbi:MAG TPA: spermidine/putrescine ABC transporter substrate-binding protein [Candidatus Limnocylindria bacterium]|jgi:spermidine/putrescine transport system substrate-binding protein|nr:spermidine/putrescine ABC transporter substrate-binding protein [Candidatus Limnocylindria bacterium]